MNKIIIEDAPKLLKEFESLTGYVGKASNLYTAFGLDRHTINEFIFNEFKLVFKLNGVTHAISEVHIIDDNKIRVKSKWFYPRVNFVYDVDDLEGALNPKNNNELEQLNAIGKHIRTSNDTIENFKNLSYNLKIEVNADPTIITACSAARFCNDYRLMGLKIININLDNIIACIRVIMHKAKERALSDRVVKTAKPKTSTKSSVLNTEIQEFSADLKEVRTDNKIFLFDDIVTYASEHVPQYRGYEYHCECWGVRGHYRRLKDGRIIFVKPYTKGKKRDELNPKSNRYFTEQGE